jgi:hypothetical protein
MPRMTQERNQATANQQDIGMSLDSQLEVSQRYA